MTWLVPEGEREFVIGDLEETFRARVSSGDVSAARRWYWRSTFANVVSTRRPPPAERDACPERSRGADVTERRRGDSLMMHFVRDARFGLRQLLRRPGFSLVAIVTLALGIGANTAIFTVTHALLLKPLPYERPDELMIVSENNLSRGWTSFAVSPANFIDWRAQNQSFRYLAAYAGRSFNYSGGPTPERLRGQVATEGFFDLIGRVPALGRIFRAEEYQSGKDNVVMLGHGFWTRAFGGRDDVVNQKIVLNGQPFTIVGVMGADWRFGGRPDIFAPRVFTAGELQSRGAHYMSVIGRLKTGVTIDQAVSEMTGIARTLEKQYQDTNAGWGVNVQSLFDAAVGNYRSLLAVLVGAVGVVLLIACANLANMHLARATVRAREMAIRTAIGAGRARLIRQLLTESCLLSSIGGALGFLLAFWSTSAFLAAYPTLLPRSQDIHVDLTVLAFTAVVSVGAAVLFGLAPALAASRTDLNDALKEGARGGTDPGRRWLRDALVVSQVALALVLLAGGGLLIRSFVALTRVEPGFETGHRLGATTQLPQPRYEASDRQIAFFDDAQARLRAMPGVESVALVSNVPLGPNDEIYSLEFEGRPPLRPDQGVSALYYVVSPEYFETMGIPLLKGRRFTDQDRAGTPNVAIVNDVFVRLHYPNENPIGQRIRMGRNSDVVREIVGVVGTVKHYALTDKEQAQMYEPLRQMPKNVMTFVMKAAGDPNLLVPSVRREIQIVDKDQPVTGVSALDDLLSNATALPRVQAVLVASLAAIALLLAAVGLYGVTAYAVSQRTQEIGVRMTLGANPGVVFAMILRRALWLAGSGLAVGVGGALLLGRVLATTLEPMLFRIESSDVSTLLVVSLVMLGVGIIASLIPARRAMRVDPIQAIRG